MFVLLGLCPPISTVKYGLSGLAFMAQPMLNVLD